MTAKTSDFTGLVYYNPGAHGFNPVVSATLKSNSSPVNEGDDAYVEVVTWNIPNNTTLYWRITNLVNMTTDRFSTLVSTFTIENNRSFFIINASADNFTAAAQQSYDVVISRTMNGPALNTVTILVNDNSQDPRILTFDLDPKNYVPASSSTITVTITYTDQAAAFPDGTGGSLFRYNGDIPTLPSLGDTFVWDGITRTIHEIDAFSVFGTSYEYYAVGFTPGLSPPGTMGVGQTVDITHGSDGLTVTDSSGQGHSGTIYGTVGYANQGADDAYLTLDGSTGYIEIPSLQNSAYRSVTMSMWINPASLSGSLITKELSYKTRLVDYSSVAALDVLASNNGTGWAYNTVDSIHPISLNTWHHITATISPTTVTFYRDGVQIYTSSWPGPIGANTARLLIGAYGDGTSELYNGKIGVSRLYTYDLSLTEVEDYYIATAPRYGMYAARQGSHTNDPQPNMIFNTLFTQNVVGWHLEGYNLNPGVIVTGQTDNGTQTFLTLNQSIMYVEAVYTFRAP